MYDVYTLTCTLYYVHRTSTMYLVLVQGRTTALHQVCKVRVHMYIDLCTMYEYDIHSSSSSTLYLYYVLVRCTYNLVQKLHRTGMQQTELKAQGLRTGT